MTNNQKGKCENCNTTKIWHHQLYHAWMISPKQFPAGRFAFAINKILYKYKVICTHCQIASTSQIFNSHLPTGPKHHQPNKKTLQLTMRKLQISRHAYSFIDELTRLTPYLNHFSNSSQRGSEETLIQVKKIFQLKCMLSVCV